MTNENYEILAEWPIFWSENEMTIEFLWNSERMSNMLIKLDDCWIFDQYSDQKIRWPQNSYEILEIDKKSLTNSLIRKLDDHGILK